MYYREAVKDDLKEYRSDKVTIINLREQIAELEQMKLSFSGAGNNTPVKSSGDNKQQIKITNIIATQDSLRDKLEAPRRRTKRIERSLTALDEKEYYVIKSFYIDGLSHRKAMEECIEKLNVDERQVNRIKAQGIDAMCKMLYGDILD